MTAAVQQPVSLDSIPGVWRGERVRALAPTETTGTKVLDEALLGGWPQGSLSQIVSKHLGFGFSLIIPTLARMTTDGRQVALVNTPYEPYAPALSSQGVNLHHLMWIQPGDEDRTLWSVEQLLLSGLVASVAFWTKHELDGNAERRLQLAAETSRCVVFAFRSGTVEGQSYAALKLSAAPAGDGKIALDVLKCRGGRAGRRLTHRFAYPRPASNPS